MSDDILREASRALRESGAKDDQGARFTRARLMASLHQQRQRRGLRTTLLVPLAAILVGSTAWAGATDKLPKVWVRIADAVAVRLSPDPPTPARSGLARISQGRAQRVRSTVLSKATGSDVSSPVADESDGLDADEPSAEERPAVTARRRAAPLVRRPDSLALYRAAHRAHFERRDYAAAVSRYNAYLSVAPAGRFSAEARYNRALCLVRLGHAAQARAALAPFARGAYGGYRQREAADLASALQRDTQGLLSDAGPAQTSRPSPAQE